MHMSVKSTRENYGVTKERISEHSDIAEKCTKILIGNIFLLCNILLKYGILDIHHHFNGSKWMPENCNARKLPSS